MTWQVLNIKDFIIGELLCGEMILGTKIFRRGPILSFG
jgi:hypothetical protein